MTQQPTPTPPQTPAPANTHVAQLTFAFPFLQKAQAAGGKGVSFTDEHAIYQMLAEKEPAGFYIVSPKGMWHGGIHVTEAGAGQSLDLEAGIRCIADGRVIAYRVNRDYPTSEMPAADNHPTVSIPYSTGFALVQHAMEFPKDNKLTFYSLYVHLMAVADYDANFPNRDKPAYWSRQYQVTEYAQDKQTGGANPQHGLRVRKSHPHGQPLGILAQGTCITVGKVEKGWGQVMKLEGPDPYATTVGGSVATFALIGGWVSLGNGDAGPLVKVVIPDSVLDRVVCPPAPEGAPAGDTGFPIKAGELIGHLGRFDSLKDGPAGTRLVHIEVFSDDSIVPFMEQSRRWVNQHCADPTAWAKLGLPVRPTILRVPPQTKLYRDHPKSGHPQGEEGDAPVTDVVQIYSLAELAKQQGKQFIEEQVDPSEQRKVNWWQVASADNLRNAIGGWVRECNFPGGAVTREFAQSWIDFQPFDGESDKAHSIFSTTDEWVAYQSSSDTAGTGDRSKLSELMTKVHGALFSKGGGSHAADDLCTMSKPDSGQYPWVMQAMSRLIVKHESEWANPDKWEELIAALIQKSESQTQYEKERERIEKLVWWTDVVAGVQGFPGSDVYHLHPIGLVANFLTDNCACANKEISAETVSRIATVAPVATIRRYIDGVNKAFVDYKFDSCISRAHFLAQIITESGEFVFTREQGEHLPYDPWRGRGLIQITHEENYSAYQTYSGVDVTSGPGAMEKLERSPDAVLSAAWYFTILHDLLAASKNDDFIFITRIINGGFNGYSRRLNYLNRAVEAMGVAECLKLNRNGIYKFEESAGYNEKRASFAWGLWNDPLLQKEGIVYKSNVEASKGYGRYIELDDAAGRPVDAHGQPLDEGWYRIGQHTKVRTYAQTRLTALGSGT
ncbi:chitinase [Paraburkholderia sp. J12]|uniref:glycoside hydrolase family 19 protein n=1 Tax=Paraburkholderia sp. J12 TaxID=2805432 RepID=UPI002ABDEAB5|nr:chitinase [Paraburkholderia sp. J12]